MESTSNSLEADAHLQLLERAKRSAAVDDFLDFGPAWYAPALATLIGGLTLYARDVGAPVNIVCGVVGAAAGLAMAVHDWKRRKVRPSMSGRSASFIALTVVIVLLVAGAWGTAISSIGDDVLAAAAVIAWLATVVLFLGIRAGLGRIRRHRGTVL